MMWGSSARRHMARYRDRGTSETGNAVTPPKRSIARAASPRSRNNPNNAEPLPVIRAGEAPTRISRSFHCARLFSRSRTTASKSFAPAAPSAPLQRCDWKLNILFRCNLIVNRENLEI